MHKPVDLAHWTGPGLCDDPTSERDGNASVQCLFCPALLLVELLYYCTC